MKTSASLLIFVQPFFETFFCFDPGLRSIVNVNVELFRLCEDIFFASWLSFELLFHVSCLSVLYCRPHFTGASGDLSPWFF